MNDELREAYLPEVAITAFLILLGLSPLPAQEPGYGALVLFESSRRIAIPVGDHLTAYDNSGRVIASGRFMGISVDRLMFAGNPAQAVPVKSVHRLVHGAHPFRRYVMTGLKYSAITGGTLVGGSVILGYLTDMTDDSYYWFGVILTTMLITPIPFAGSVLWGALRQLTAQRYLIGEGEWQIVLEGQAGKP